MTVNVATFWQAGLLRTALQPCTQLNDILGPSAYVVDVTRCGALVGAVATVDYFQELARRAALGRQLPTAGMCVGVAG